MKNFQTKIDKLKSNIGKSQKAAFLAVWMSSLLAHGFMYFNKFSYHDDMGELFRLGGTFVYGRWFLGILGKIWSEMIGNVSLPLWNGILSTFFISISALMVVRILDIRGVSRGVFVGSLMMVFPAVVSTYAFMFTAPHYFFALFLGVFAVWLQEVLAIDWKKILLSIGCLTLSLGIYQAYLAVPMCLVLLVILIKCNQENGSKVDILKFIAKYLLILIASLGIYFVINLFFLKALQMEMTTAQGLNSGYQLSIQGIGSAIQNTYANFFAVEYDGIHTSMWMKLAVWVGLLCDIILAGVLLLHRNPDNGQKRSDLVFMKAGIVAVLLLFPFTANAIYVLAGHEDTYIHLIMRYSLVFIWILPLVLLEQCERIEKALNPADQIKNPVLWFLKYSLVFLIGIQILLYIHLDNTAYLKAFFVQEQSTSYFNRLVTKIETAPGYRDEYPVVYLGAREKFSDSMTGMEELERMSLTGFNGDLLYQVNDYTWETYMAYYCGYEPDEVLPPESVADWTEIESMPCYPDEGSVVVRKETVVVKFAEITK